MRSNKYATILFYVLIGAIASLGLLSTYYAVLRLNSSLGLLYAHNSLRFLIIYLSLTFASAIVFGINTTLFVYQWRRFGLRQLFHFSTGGIGAVVGILASSCPVCGSAIFSAFGIIGGLSSLPFQGLEIKAISLLLLTLSLIYSVWQIHHPRCQNDTCPAPHAHQLKKTERQILSPLTLATGTLILFTIVMLRSDTIWSPRVIEQGYTCSHKST